MATPIISMPIPGQQAGAGRFWDQEGRTVRRSIFARAKEAPVVLGYGVFHRVPKDDSPTKKHKNDNKPRAGPNPLQSHPVRSRAHCSAEVWEDHAHLLYDDAKQEKPLPTLPVSEVQSTQTRRPSEEQCLTTPTTRSRASSKSRDELFLPHIESPTPSVAYLFAHSPKTPTPDQESLSITRARSTPDLHSFQWPQSPSPPQQHPKQTTSPPYPIDDEEELSPKLAVPTSLSRHTPRRASAAPRIELQSAHAETLEPPHKHHHTPRRASATPYIQVHSAPPQQISFPTPEKVVQHYSYATGWTATQPSESFKERSACALPDEDLLPNFARYRRYKMVETQMSR